MLDIRLRLIAALLLAPLAAFCVAAEPNLPAKADASSKETQSYLFIGNGFTMRHQLPTLFAALGQEGWRPRPARWWHPE